MPELPDVQVFREYLDATALHRSVATTRVRDELLLEDVSRQALARRLKGRPLEESRRHGKHLFARAADVGWLRLHFGMTGSLEFRQNAGALPDHTALSLEFEDGSSLSYLNVRRFGEIGWADDVDGWIEERGLGPDALGLDLRTFRSILEGRRGTIKGALMDQSAIAGIGNVYGDEVLFQSGVHPRTPVAALDDDTVARIHGCVRPVLAQAIEARVESFPGSFLVPRREEGAPCPKCGGTIAKIEVVGRPTYVCPDHQIEPE